MEYQEFYNEKVASDMSSFEASGLVDEMKVYGWVVNALKQFGTLFATLQEQVIEVKNYEAQLPDGFIKLNLALKCVPHHYKVEKEDDQLQFSKFWIERHEKTTTWDSCEDCCEEEFEKRIEEKIYYRDSSVRYYYDKPTILKVVEGVKGKQCMSDSPNLKVKGAEHQISIMKNSRKIQANFESGNIYLKYYGYETDEEGFIIIPESNQGDLENYLEYLVKGKILENVVLNGDNISNEASMISFYEAKTRDAFSKTMTDAKASVWTKEAREGWKRRNKLKGLSHEFAFKL